MPRSLLRIVARKTRRFRTIEVGLAVILTVVITTVGITAFQNHDSVNKNSDQIVKLQAQVCALIRQDNPEDTSYLLQNCNQK